MSIQRKISRAEGSQTTSQQAPKNITRGEILRFEGIPVVAVQDADEGALFTVHKRETLELSCDAIGLFEPVTGPLFATFAPIAGAPAWERFLAWSTEGVGEFIGNVEEVRTSQRLPIQDTITLSLADGQGGVSGGGGGGGDPTIEPRLASLEDSQTEQDAQLASFDDSQTDQDAEIEALDASLANARMRVATLEGLIGAGGEGPDLSGIQDQIDDLQVQIQAVSDKVTILQAGNTNTNNRLNKLDAASKALLDRCQTIRFTVFVGDANDNSAIPAGATKVLSFGYGNYGSGTAPIYPGAPGAPVDFQYGMARGTPRFARNSDGYVYEGPFDYGGDPSGSQAEVNAAVAKRTLILCPLRTLYRLQLMLRPVYQATGQGDDQPEGPGEIGSLLSLTIRQFKKVPAPGGMVEQATFMGQLTEVNGHFVAGHLSTIVEGGPDLFYQLELKNNGAGVYQINNFGPSSYLVASVEGANGDYGFAF